MNVNGIRVKWYYSSVDAVIDNTKTSNKILCSIEDEEKVICCGEALCSPNDTYDKEFGRKLALTRAVSISELDKATKASIWEGYRNMTKVPRW